MAPPFFTQNLQLAYWKRRLCDRLKTSFEVRDKRNSTELSWGAQSSLLPASPPHGATVTLWVGVTKEMYQFVWRSQAPLLMKMKLSSGLSELQKCLGESDCEQTWAWLWTADALDWSRKWLNGTVWVPPIGDTESVSAQKMNGISRATRRTD